MTDWTPLWLSLQVGALAAFFILTVGVALAVLLMRWRWRGRLLIETLINLPLVLPPTVVGFYLLQVLGRGSLLYDILGVRLLFTWPAAALASAVVGLPMMVQSALAALEQVDREVEDAARVDGASEFQVLFRVMLPMARRGILAGFVLGTARALGDFGATLMIAGNIPGRTQTLPLAIYDAVQAGRTTDAAVMAFALSSLAFGVLWLTYHMGSGLRGVARRVPSSRRNSAE